MGQLGVATGWIKWPGGPTDAAGGLVDQGVARIAARRLVK
jgi:hypothetical protein